MILLFNYAGATVIALLIFLIFYYMRPVVITEANGLFFILIISEIVGLAANLLSAYADNNGYKYYKGILIILNTIYYLSYLFRFFLFTLYYRSLLQVDRNKKGLFILSCIFSIFVAFIIITSPFTGLIYTISPEGVFSTGKLVITLYIANAITLLVDIYYLLISFKKLNSKDRITVILSIFALLSCCVIDYLFIEYVISDIFILLAISILYLIFENPEIYYDNKINILNFQAFTESVTNNLYRHKNGSILSFAIHNFNEINEIYGSEQIDIALVEIGNYLRTNYSTFNSFYLQNGRFAVTEKSDKGVKEIKDKIENRFKHSWKLKNDTKILLTISIIEIEKTSEFNSFEQIESCVKQAAFELKKLTSNDITVNHYLFDKVARKSRVLKVLIKALETDNLFVYFQPIVDSHTRKIIAAEALVRLYDEKMGIISPNEFITMAEENGYIEKLGEQVLNKVCIIWQTYDFEKYGLQWINVNLSPIQCQNKKIVDNLKSIITKNNIKPQNIHFEITEESLIDKDVLKDQINKLIDNGFKISLDDFGTGFSNFYSIKAFAFSNIKLDMSLVNDHFNDKDNLLPGVVNIFRNRNLTVTAEGIETKEMADEFEHIGVNYLQGYYFSKPICEKDFLTLLQKNQ